MRKKSQLIILGLALSLPLGIAALAETDNTDRMATPFELKDLDGKTQRLNDYLQAGPVFLWFTNFCGGCQSAMPELRAAFADENTPLLIVSLLGDDRKTPTQIKIKQEMNFPILLDPEGEVTKLYSGTYVPKTCPLENFYAIGKDGVFVYSGHYPGLDGEELDGLIAKLK
jgi:peroxiredoxin